MLADLPTTDGARARHVRGRSPILDVVTGKIAGYEALSRFTRPGWNPQQWFTCARACGLGARLEAAAIDGATTVQTFFRVVVPQIMGTIVTVFVTVLISVMKLFDIVFVMTNGSFKTNVVGTEFYNQLFTYFDYGTASAIVVLLMLAVVPVMWYQVRHFKREEAA